MSSAPAGAVAGVAAYEIVEGTVPVVQTIRLGCLARACIMSQYGRRNRGGTTTAFAGKDADGMPLTGHTHAFYVPTDDDLDGMLDHVYIVRGSGFSAAELAAIRSVSVMKSPGDGICIRVKHCPSVPDSAILSLNRRKWVSSSPFLLNRHVKRRGDRVIDSPESQVRLELERRYPSYIVERVSVEAGIPMIRCKLRPDQFVSSRRPWDATRPAFEVSLAFTKPISGPLLLGHGCHFGMGSFVPHGPA